MDRPREASLFGGSVPPSPTPPLALSDLLAQRPFPTYTPPYGHYLVTPDAADAADDQSIQVLASGNATQASPDHQERQEILGATSIAAHNPEVLLRPAPSPASVTDWQAKRNQLRPSKNQGSKADWIRGWSEGVGAHGCETYCACSEASSAGDPNLISKGTDIKSGVRAILRVKRTVSSNANGAALPVTTISATGICPNCGRMTSPANSAPASLRDEERDVKPKGGFAKKLNGLLQRAKHHRRKPSNNQASSHVFPAKGGSTKPPGATNHRGPNGSTSDSNDSDNDGSNAGRTKTEARLLRAKELLRKSGKPSTEAPANE
ncbi:hypothetical protein B0T16DRAFT_52153 [Cercophora newfieldiana]|uniref:Uncharacterized protein n=1 Tax=Cercophora newfieldiana TaxID=92897 RepID=A0AA39YR39_9PEZI|nr:hypothetical protein B0T16DRAFT_52153 [Cercophora newfieldiana]